jgi:hypothetical protein
VLLELEQRRLLWALMLNYTVWKDRVRQSFFTTSIASGKMATFDNNMRLDKLGVE